MRQLDEADELGAGLLLDPARCRVGGGVANVEMIEAECEEGCLSVPGYYDKVTRAARITVRARNERGEPIERTADGLLAVCIQHEMDHLDGKVFVERLSPLKRARLLAKLRKKQKLAG